MTTLLSSIVFTMCWRVWLLVPSGIRRRAYIRLKNRYQTRPFEATRLAFGLRFKWTFFDPRIEANNTRFVLDNTTIPVPRVLDVLPPVKTTDSRGIIIMEWIDGETLSSWASDRTKWPEEYQHHIARLMGDDTMSTSELDDLQAILKHAVPTVDVSDGQGLIDDLHNAVSQLRAIPPPSSSTVSGLDGQPLIWSRCLGTHQLLQPTSLPDFHRLLINQVGYQVRIPHVLQAAEPVLHRKYRMCFTHSDLHTDNILVKDGKLAAIIDWECAGWYPEYWECTMLNYHSTLRRTTDVFWKQVDLFGGDYEEELSLERILWQSSGDGAVRPGDLPGNPLDQPIDAAIQ